MMPTHSILLIGLLLAGTGSCKERKIPMAQDGMETPAVQNDPNTVAEATFAAGCFWGVENFFAAVPGVLSTEVGFMGGTVKNPSYEQVCRGNTNHAEVVHLRYDPKQISYESLVKLFFKMHDPTSRNRQGPDIGTQYRSAIFFYTDLQQKTAQAVMRKLTGERRSFKQRIVTQLVPATAFWRAEEYHQQYFKKNPGRSCHTNFCPALLEDK